MRSAIEGRAIQPRTVTGGEAVVRALEAHGVEVLFGIPGTHSLPMYRHLANSSIRHVLPRHEQGAAFAADGYARSTGRPGVCLVTTGPGVTNAATAAAEAYSDSVPVLIISPGMPSDVYRRDLGYVHEAKDQSLAMENLVAWSHRVHSPADVVATIDRAFDEFATRRPRPIHVEVPLDVLDATAEVVIERGSSAPPRAPDPLRIGEAVSMLQSSRKPVVVLGGGAQGAASGIKQLAHTLDAVVATTANGKGSFPENDDLSIGAVLCFRAGREVVAESDVVLAIGTELGDSDLEGEPLKVTGRVIRIDIDPAQLNKNLHADCAIEGDATAAVDSILSSLVLNRRDGAARVRAVRARLATELENKAEGVFDATLAIIRTLADDAIVVCDTSMLCWNGLIPSRFATAPRSCLNPTGYATLGYALPAAIGAKVAHPDRDVIAVIGDGGILFTIGELATAVDEQLTLPIVVSNNHGYGEIRHGMIARGIEPIGVTFDPPDFVLLAEAFRARGARAQNAGELERAIKAALKTKGPTLIEVVF